MAAESESLGPSQIVSGASQDTKSSPTSSSQAAAGSSGSNSTRPNLSWSHIHLDISNSVLPLDRLSPTPSAKDGLSEEVEMQIRSLGCELIQLAGKLLRLPQVAMATGCVLFQRFYYVKSLVRLPFDVVAMSCVCLASKIEESPRRIRDIINVFNHIKQVRAGKTITPVVLDPNYISLKNQVIKAERRVLKELGFCVHVKHPHKIIVMYLKWLEMLDDQHRELLQMSWNFMNDSLRTDVFVRYPPETIAVACIYLSARKLKEPLPKNPAWFEVLDVDETDIKDCCQRIICLYNRKKANFDDLEAMVESLRKKMEDDRRAARELNSSLNTPSQSSPTSRAGSPTKDQVTNQDNAKSHLNGANGSSKDKDGDNHDKADQIDGSSPIRHSKKHKHKHKQRSRSPSYDDYRDRSSSYGRLSAGASKKSKKRSSRSPSSSPPKKRKHGHHHHHHHHHKDKIRYRSRSRDRDMHHGRGTRGGVASIGLNDPPMPKQPHRSDRDRISGYDRKNRDYNSRSRRD